jgi:hypothetical protein
VERVRLLFLAYMTLFVWAIVRVVWWVVNTIADAVHDAFTWFVLSRHGWIIAILAMAYYWELVHESGTCP